MKHRMTEDRVWELIEEGQLGARFVNDAILIYRESDDAEPSVPRLDIDLEAPGFLMNDLVARSDQAAFDPAPRLDLHPHASEPPEAHAREAPIAQTAREAKELVTSAGELARHAPPSLARQLDEEASQREFFLFAQDSIERTVKLSQQLLAGKDEMLILKDEKIAFLERALQDKDLEMRRVKRELENMQILMKISQQPQILRPLLSEQDGG